MSYALIFGQVARNLAGNSKKASSRSIEKQKVAGLSSRHLVAASPDYVDHTFTHCLGTFSYSIDVEYESTGYQQTDNKSFTLNGPPGIYACTIGLLEGRHGQVIFRVNADQYMCFDF